MQNGALLTKKIYFHKYICEFIMNVLFLPRRRLSRSFCRVKSDACNYTQKEATRIIFFMGNR